ncbi:MAG TPA: TonB-dependent receptor, partial [Bryobacteraceae bacterium]|nr:TonB-dependent receptor [Bryobacteraceae bacterium]
MPLLSQEQTPNTAAAPDKLEPVHTSVTITGEIQTATPSFISVLGRRDMEQQAGINLDDRLRILPGFSLFRRSSSLVANPTTQGVSLRGLGSSGASRTLVLWDGVPVNDPFGGWVYWTRIPPEDLERVEVIRGATTTAFGDRAMSGAISLFSRPAQRYRLTGFYEGGNANTHIVGGGASHIWRDRFAASTRVRALTTDGYYIVPEDRRGSADTRAGVRLAAGDVRLDYLGVENRLNLKFDVLAEERENGTRLTQNSTGLGTISANYSRQWTNDQIAVIAYHTREQFHASFSSISADRNTERITFLQRVPSEATGGAAYWRKSLDRVNWVAGADFQRVEGTSIDTLVPTGQRIGGGSQFQRAAFGQLDFAAGPARLFAGARGQITDTGKDFFGPTGGFVVGRSWFRARGSAYRGFRAPTLNELYREFRVGNAVTQANPALRAETVFGSEVGFDVIGENTRLGVTFFRNDLSDLITNVTLSSTPALIVRQRQNAASALSRGLDIELRSQWHNVRAELGYLFADSRFETGERIPQVPKHQGTAQLTYARGGTLVSGGLRAYGGQFEDDRNQFLLPGFAVWQFAARQTLYRGLSANVAVDN